MGPEGGGDELAEGGGTRAIRGGRGVDKVKWSQEIVARVREVDGVGPGNVFGGVRGGGGRELNTGAVLDDIVGGDGVFVPKGPPALVLFREGLVGTGRGKEVAVKVAGREVGSGGLRQIHLDKGKLGTKGCLESVGNEEQFVFGVVDGGEEVCWGRCFGEGGIGM